MKIHFEYYAGIRERSGTPSETIETDATDLRALYASIRTKYRLPYQPEQIKVAVNNELCDWDASLTQGDTVIFIPPVSGG